MPKEQKKVIGREKKFVVIGNKYQGRKKDYKIVDYHFGAARRVVNVHLPISKYG